VVFLEEAHGQTRNLSQNETQEEATKKEGTGKKKVAKA
jgi:hypothetical protein